MCIYTYLILWCTLYITSYGAADDIIRSRLNSPLFPSLPLLFLSLPLLLYYHHHHYYYDCYLILYNRGLSLLLAVPSLADSLLVVSFVTCYYTLPLNCLVYTLRYPTSSYHPPWRRRIFSRLFLAFSFLLDPDFVAFFISHLLLRALFV